MGSDNQADTEESDNNEQENFTDHITFDFQSSGHGKEVFGLCEAPVGECTLGADPGGHGVRGTGEERH